jgi:hypothetical protein
MSALQPSWVNPQRGYVSKAARLFDPNDDAKETRKTVRKTDGTPGVPQPSNRRTFSAPSSAQNNRQSVHTLCKIAAAIKDQRGCSVAEIEIHQQGGCPFCAVILAGLEAVHDHAQDIILFQDFSKSTSVLRLYTDSHYEIYIPARGKAPVIP